VVRNNEADDEAADTNRDPIVMVVRKHSIHILMMKVSTSCVPKLTIVVAASLCLYGIAPVCLFVVLDVRVIINYYFLARRSSCTCVHGPLIIIQLGILKSTSASLVKWQEAIRFFPLRNDSNDIWKNISISLNLHISSW
jgi:hypothetical protein